MALPDLTPESRCYLDGRLVESSGGARFDNVNPRGALRQREPRHGGGDRHRRRRS
jgi:hypothetical protein